MVFGAVQLMRLRRWRRFLLKHSGCYFSRALTSCSIPRPILPEDYFADSGIFGTQALNESDPFYAYSDAFVEGVCGGLGGYVHGEYWHHDLSEEDCALMHIGAWEFVALGVNIVLYGERLQMQRVLFLGDALGPIQIMRHGAAHAPVLQIVHDIIIHLPEFCVVSPNGLQEHVYGEVNVLADAASRSRFELIHDIGRQMGFRPNRVDLSGRAYEFISQVRRAVEAYKNDAIDLSLEAPPRKLSRAEIQRMNHLGASFLGSEDTPLRFRSIRFNVQTGGGSGGEVSRAKMPN